MGQAENLRPRRPNRKSGDMALPDRGLAAGERGRNGEAGGQDRPVGSGSGTGYAPGLPAVEGRIEGLIDRWIARLLFGFIVALMIEVGLAWLDQMRRHVALSVQLESSLKASLEAHKATQQKLDRNYDAMRELKSDDAAIVDNQRFIMRNCGK